MLRFVDRRSVADLTVIVSLAFAHRHDVHSGRPGHDVGDGEDTILGASGDDTINGNTGDDDINGNANNNGLSGGAGNDTIDGFGGNNTINGGDGNDQIIGRSGNDTLRGDDGNDVIQTGTGVDNILGGDGSDVILLGDLNGDTADGGSDGSIDGIQFSFTQSVNIDLATGVATLVGGGGSGTFTNFESTTVFGAGGATVSGTNGFNNIAVSGTGNTINLFDGNDGLNVTTGGNAIDGGAGVSDSVRFDTNEDVTVDLSVVGGFTQTLADTGTIAGFEVIRTLGGDDNLTGDANSNRFESGTGADTIDTGDGDDIIFVVDGGDTIDGGGDDDDFEGEGELKEVSLQKTKSPFENSNGLFNLCISRGSFLVAFFF